MIKNKIIIIAFCIIICLSGAIVLLLKNNKSVSDKLNIATNNYKTYESLYSKTKESNKELLLTIDMLNYSQDSIVQEINKIRKEKKILNKEIKRLSQVISETQLKDTVSVRDTVFQKGVKIDTTLKNPWYTIDLGLYYPDTIAVGVKIPSKQTIMVYNRKETIDPPKKCWLGRLFQKKHIVTNVQVIEENPYIKTTQSTFIEVK